MEKTLKSSAKGIHYAVIVKDSGYIYGSVEDICGVFFTGFNELDIEVFYARYICIQQDNGRR